MVEYFVDTTTTKYMIVLLTDAIVNVSLVLMYCCWECLDYIVWYEGTSRTIFSSFLILQRNSD